MKMILIKLVRIQNWMFSELSHMLLVISITLLIAITFSLLRAMDRLEVATMYIHELEEVIESDGTVVGDVCGGDGYAEWYGGM